MDYLVKKFPVLIVALGLFAVQVNLFAQGAENEPVDKYRKTTEFEMPDPGKPDGSGVVIQSSVDNGPSDGGIHYEMDAQTQKLLDIHKRVNDNVSEADGFRIQIYAGGDQALANEARADFLAKFSHDDYEIHQTWDPPHFRVRIGDFRTRAEAMQALPNVRRIFPDGFVVADKIKLKKSRRPVPVPPSDSHTNEEDENKQ